ncbi:MAG: sulfatase-like hydrolase/transferase [Anaeromyxobacter sp.]
MLFLGDNGTEPRRSRPTPATAKSQGGKGKSTDPGMHVPLIANWPGKIAKGKVCDDLVDSTDFLPTLLAAAELGSPAGIPFDGTSFLPQLQGETGTPRQWIYSWYAREGGPKASKEFAADKRFKLYRDGEMFDVAADILEKSPLNAAALSPEAKAARETLQAALDKYKDARPANIARQAGKGGAAD